mmetsp:Transcript_19935/g.29721  ORF Transcript_19935/g.29721 Transcript_19935/m.29721 type:complete len:92 (+) Transcript_19935:40-315(+)
MYCSSETYYGIFICLPNALRLSLSINHKSVNALLPNRSVSLPHLASSNKGLYLDLVYGNCIMKKMAYAKIIIWYYQCTLFETIGTSQDLCR